VIRQRKSCPIASDEPNARIRCERRAIPLRDVSWPVVLGTVRPNVAASISGDFPFDRRRDDRYSRYGALRPPHFVGQVSSATLGVHLRDLFAMNRNKQREEYLPARYARQEGDGKVGLTSTSPWVA
jgi:hypothetical protein